MNFVKALFNNIMGIDGIIILLAAANLIAVATMVRRFAMQTENALKKVVYQPLSEIIASIVPDNQDHLPLDLHRLKEQREKEDVWHHLYIAITSILPLMGILGTVIALLRIDAFELTIVSSNFTSALSSTFWGLLGAIACRIMEGTLSPKIERNQENFRMLVSRLGQDGYHGK